MQVHQFRLRLSAGWGASGSPPGVQERLQQSWEPRLITRRRLTVLQQTWELAVLDWTWVGNCRNCGREALAARGLEIAFAFPCQKGRQPEKQQICQARHPCIRGVWTNALAEAH